MLIRGYAAVLGRSSIVLYCIVLYNFYISNTLNIFRTHLIFLIYHYTPFPTHLNFACLCYCFWQCITKSSLLVSRFIYQKLSSLNQSCSILLLNRIVYPYFAHPIIQVALIFFSFLYWILLICTSTNQICTTQFYFIIVYPYFTSSLVGFILLLSSILNTCY